MLVSSTQHPFMAGKLYLGCSRAKITGASINLTLTYGVGFPQQESKLRKPKAVGPSPPITTQILSHSERSTPLSPILALELWSQVSSQGFKGGFYRTESSKFFSKGTGLYLQQSICKFKHEGILQKSRVGKDNQD